MSVEDLTKVISAATALVAVIVGPLLQWRIARRQAADNISSKRQIWIDELRRDCAELLTLMGRLNELRRPNPDLSTEDAAKNFDEAATANFRAHELTVRVQLRLNPNELEHKKLMEGFQALAEASKDPPPAETIQQRRAAMQEFGVARDKVIAQLQRILKAEWDRVKRGDVK